MIRLAVVLSAAVLVAACGERAQVAATPKKTDDKPWDARGSAYTANGWQAGDEKAWEAQLRARAQSQNEYARTAPSAVSK